VKGGIREVREWGRKERKQGMKREERKRRGKANDKGGKRKGVKELGGRGRVTSSGLHLLQRNSVPVFWQVWCLQVLQMVDLKLYFSTEMKMRPLLSRVEMTSYRILRVTNKVSANLKTQSKKQERKQENPLRHVNILAQGNELVVIRLKDALPPAHSNQEGTNLNQDIDLRYKSTKEITTQIEKEKACTDAQLQV
jgi:hypothetical protein